MHSKSTSFRSLCNDITNIGVINMERQNLAGHYVVYALISLDNSIY
jgi:hypothetical protein